MAYVTITIHFRPFCWSLRMMHLSSQWAPHLSHQSHSPSQPMTDSLLWLVPFILCHIFKVDLHCRFYQYFNFPLLSNYIPFRTGWIQFSHSLNCGWTFRLLYFFLWIVPWWWTPMSRLLCGAVCSSLMQEKLRTPPEGPMGVPCSVFCRCGDWTIPDCMRVYSFVYVVYYHLSPKAVSVDEKVVSDHFSTEWSMVHFSCTFWPLALLL